MRCRRRRTQYDLKKARERAHSEGLKKATGTLWMSHRYIRAWARAASEAKAAIGG